MANQQQFMSSQGRLTGPSRPLGTMQGLGQHMGGGLIRTGTGSMGGAVGTVALASGLEELKRTADHWMQDQQATHQRNEVMSTKLKEQEKINKGLLKEKEKLQETVQELKARIREDAKHVQTVLERLQFVEGVHNGLLQSVGKAGEELHNLESKRSAIEVAINNQGELCGDIESKYGELLAKQQATEEHLNQASAAYASLQDDYEAARRQVAALEHTLSAERRQHDILKESATNTIQDLTNTLNTARAACAAKEQEIIQCAREHADKLVSMQDVHASSIKDLEEQLMGKQQKLEATQAALSASEAQLADLRLYLAAKQGQIKELEQQLEISQDEASKATADLCETQQELEAQQAALNNKEEELKHAHINIEKLDKALQTAQFDKEALSRRASELEAQLQEAEQKCRGTAGRVTDLEAALQALNQVHEEVTAEMDKSKALTADLQQQLEQKKTAIEELQQQVAAGAAEQERLIREAEEARTKLAAEIEQLNSVQTTTSEEAAAIQETLSALQAEHTTLIEEKAAMEERIAEINQQLEAANAATAETQSKALQDVNSLKEQLAKERAANRKNTESVAKRMEEISGRASKADELTKEILLLRTQLSELQASKADVEEATARLREEHTAELLKQVQDTEAAAKAASELAAAKLTQELAAAAAAAAKQVAEAEAAAVEKHKEEVAQLEAAAAAQKQELDEMLQDAISQLEELNLARSKDTEQINSITKQLLENEVVLQQMQATSAEAIDGLQQQLDQQLKIAAEMEAMVQERESEASELRGEVSELKKSIRLLEQSCEQTQAALAEKEEVLLNITSIGRKGLMGQVDSKAPTAPSRRKAAAAVKQRSVGGTAVRGGKLQRSSGAAAYMADAEHDMRKQSGASDEEEEEMEHQNASADEHDEQVEDEILEDKPHEEEQPPVKHVHFKTTPPSNSRYTNDVPSSAATRPSTARNSSVNGARSNRSTPPTAAAAADITPPEFEFAASRPSQAAIEARAKVIQRNSAINASKKRARAQEPQERYADLSSLQVTQQGDDEDDAAGGYVYEEELAPPTAKRAVAAAMDRVKAGNNSAKRTGSTVPGSAMKPSAHGATHTGQGRGNRPTSSITQNSQQPRSSAATKSVTGKTGGRFGTMSVQSGMSMDRHHNAGAEVSSGRVNNSRSRAIEPTAAGNTVTQRAGRMGPPVPKFNSNSSKMDEAQQKANAAAKQSAAMDIFGSLGF